MKSFFKLREELDSCCDECADDNLYGSVEEDFEPTGEEQYEDWNEINEGGPGLWANIHAKRQRIKAGSGERMREPGSKGAPTASALKRAAESVDEATTPLQFILKNPGKEYPPFDPDPPKKNPGFVKGKKSFSGLARHLAKTAMNKAANVKEEIDLDEAKDTDKYTYIDQSGGQVIKGKSGTYVGYTHSATKGKGANILKHNTTKKYYAAGGSSTAFTKKTTLHDTPEDAARAYHKGNLAEASPMIKPPTNEFGKKEDAFAHAKKHGGKVMKKTFTHPTSGMQTVSYVVREDAELAEAIKLNSKVKIHAPGKDYHGKVGHVGEIRKGLHDKAPKTYTVDYDYDTKTGNKKSIQLDKSQLKMHNEETEIDEAIKKPNATTRHLRQYPVSDKDVAKPVKQSEYQHHVVSKLDGNVLASYKSKEAAHRNAHGNPVVSGSLETIGDRKYVREQSESKPVTYYSLVHKATNKVLSTHKDLESAKDEHRGMDQGERAHYRIATSTKAPKSFSMKEDAEGVAEKIELQEAEKNGKKVQLNKPFRTSDGKGKFAVYTKNEKGNVVKVNFGDTTGLTIKTSNPDRRRNFRARHNCDNPGPRHKARFWSCKSWSRGTVSKGLGI